MAEVKPLLSCSYHKLTVYPYSGTAIADPGSRCLQGRQCRPILTTFLATQGRWTEKPSAGPFRKRSLSPPFENQSNNRIEESKIETPKSESRTPNSDYQNSDSENSENRNFKQIDRVERLENPETPSTCRCVFLRWGIWNTLTIGVLCSVVETDP